MNYCDNSKALVWILVLNSDFTCCNFIIRVIGSIYDGTCGLCPLFCYHL